MELGNLHFHMVDIALKSTVVETLKTIVENNEITIQMRTLFDHYANHKYLSIFLLIWFLCSKSDLLL